MKRICISRHSYTSTVLMQALACPTAVKLEAFHWVLPTRSPAKQLDFFRIVMHILRDFSSKCQAVRPLMTNHERTFMFERLMPIFHYFSNHSGLITFQWYDHISDTHSYWHDHCRGEKLVKSLRVIGNATSYADGIAYAAPIGYLDDERLVLEASSGGLAENQKHTTCMAFQAE